MMGWQWHQLDHMQIICTSLQTDDHASTSDFYRPDVLSAAQPTASTATGIMPDANWEKYSPDFILTF